MKKLFRWLIVLWFVVYSALFTPLAYAASAGSWAFSSFDVAKNLVTAMKNGGTAAVTVAKSPISQKIAKGIVGGAIAGAALPLAISQLSGIALNALDWVLDPENNAVKYKRKIDANTYDYKSSAGTKKTYPTPELACDYLTVVNSGRGIPGASFSHFESARNLCWYNDNGVLKDWSTVQKITPTNQSGSIPIPTVADKIYDNAKTDAASSSIVNDVVKDYVNEGSADVALDAAKAEIDATHNCGAGTSWNGSACVATPTTPDTPFDPSSIIDAINSVFDAVMSLPDVINNALDSLLVDIKDFFQPVIDLVTDFFQWFKDTALEWKNDFVEEYRSFRDWIKSEPDPQTDSKPDIDTTPPTKSATDFDTDYLRFGGQCPATPSTSLSVGAVSVPLSIDLTPLCDFVVMVRPAILAMAYLSALFVVARAIGETQ